MKHYNLVTLQGSWIFHEVLAGSTLDGKRPQDASENLLPPSSVEGGISNFSGCTSAGLFYHVAKEKRQVSIHSGRGSRRRVISHRMPRLPMDPTISLEISYPETFFTVFPPAPTI